MKTTRIYTFSLLILALSACSTDKIRGVYRIDIQQGNDITQDMINQLKPGMSKNQVAFIMGTPLIIDTFHPERWDYIYAFHPGNGDREQRRITVHFSSEKLSHLEGNMQTVTRAELPQNVKSDSNVVVPLSDKKIGLVEEIKEKIGFTEDEQEVTEDIDLFQDRPTPVPSSSKNLLDRISGNSSASTGTAAESISDISPSDEVESTSPSLYQSFKNTIGLGE